MIWKLLLKVETLDVKQYLNWVGTGPSVVSTKSESPFPELGVTEFDVVKNDTFRTLATDTQFKGRVKEEMLIRLLEAFIWKHQDSDDNELPFSYVQGKQQSRTGVR
jgi:cell cycle arrest protein BUB2